MLFEQGASGVLQCVTVTGGHRGRTESFFASPRFCRARCGGPLETGLGGSSSYILGYIAGPGSLSTCPDLCLCPL